MNRLLETLQKLELIPPVRKARIMESDVSDDRINMTVQLEVTKSQGLALQAMFEYMNSLGDAGGSRKVAFYADGDGNFKPHAKVSYDGEMPELTEEFSRISVVEDHDGDRVYDFDPIGWALHKQEHPEDFPE